MKNFKFNTLSVIALAGILSLGTASAEDVKIINSIPGVSGTALSVKIEDGVAIITGTVTTRYEYRLAKKRVAKMEGVDRVINRLDYAGSR